LALAACSSSKTPAFPDDGAAGAKTAGSGEVGMDASPPKENLPPGTVARKQLDQALLRGPGWLLSKIQTEEVLRQNKFIGWRLISFPAEWDGSGLQPGDVVTEVNGTTLEHPDDMWTVWMLASDASDIKISYERNGQPAVAVVKIQGAPRPETKKALEAGAMTPPASGPAQGVRSRTAAEAQGKKRFDTKVIGGESSQPIETSEY